MNDVLPEVFIIDSCEPHNFRSQFCGMAYTGESIIIDQTGFEKYCASHGLPRPTDLEGGRFCAILYDGQHLQAFCDPMGQDTIYYYSGNELTRSITEDWCISNSFISLVKHLHWTGRSLSLHAPALCSFFLSDGRGHGAQLLSHQTAIREIKVLPIGCELTATRSTGHLRLRKYLPLPGRGDKSQKHRDGVELYLQKTVGRIRALSTIGETRIFCDLSGGRDSRIVSGLLIKSDISPSLTYINSNKKAEQDYVIADKVANFLGCKLMDSALLPESPRLLSPFAYWAASSSCCYLPVNSGTGRLADKFDFRLRGGNFIATKFRKFNVDDVTELIHSFVSNQQAACNLSDDFLSFFRDLDLPKSDPLAMHYHYMNIRSRFHYGKNWLPRGQRIVTPLLDRALADLFLRKGSIYRRFYCDLLLAIDKELAFIPFDHSKKTINSDLAMQSPFFNKPARLDCAHIPDITIYHNTRQNESKCSKISEFPDQSLKRTFIQKYNEFEGVAMDAKLFTKAYRDVARQEIVSGDDLGRDFRHAAHVLSTGILLDSIS